MHKISFVLAVLLTSGLALAEQDNLKADADNEPGFETTEPETGPVGSTPRPGTNLEPEAETGTQDALKADTDSEPGFETTEPETGPVGTTPRPGTDLEPEPLEPDAEESMLEDDPAADEEEPVGTTPRPGEDLGDDLEEDMGAPTGAPTKL